MSASPKNDMVMMPKKNSFGYSDALININDIWHHPQSFEVSNVNDIV